MTARRTGNICVCYSQLPLPEIYSPTSEAFHPAYTGETKRPGIEVAPALSEAEVSWVTDLPAPIVWLVFERDGCRVAIPDVPSRNLI